MAKKPIYVEIEIAGETETVWKYSQDPSLHEQWDIRFSSIEYEEKEPGDETQRFTYVRNVMPGVAVSGWGKSRGTHVKESGERTSSLHFGTEDKLSPITEGKGYWRYVPNGNGTTFLTQYDYDVRYGAAGRLVDRLFRPVMGWGTALSFDVLKRWIETGERPATQYRRFFAYYLISLLFAFVWLYQGLVPKVLVQHPLEVSMLMQLSPLSDSQAVTAVFLVGIAEIVLACLWLVPRLQKWLFRLQAAVFPLLGLSAIIAEPSVAVDPFNVVTLNGALWVLSIAGLLLEKELPTARSCVRKRRNNA